MMGRAAALALLPGLVVAGAVAATPGGAPHLPAPPPISRAEWDPQPGDLVFRASDDLVGDRIRSASGADAIYSHVGIVVTRDGAPAVVDVSPFGSGYVEYSDVSTFTTDPTTTNLLVVRPRVAFNAQRLDDDAARLAAAGVPFDYAFDMEDESALYCAELAFNLLRDAGVDLRSVRWTQMYVPFAGDRNLVTPDALARADTLQPVYRRKAS